MGLLTPSSDENVAPTPGGLLDGLPDQNTGNGLSLFLSPQDMASIDGLDNSHAGAAAAIPVSASQDAPVNGGGEGLAHAIDGTNIAAAGSHGLGYWTGRAAGAAHDAPMLKGLEHLNNMYAYPLTAVEGVVHGINDVRNGASPEEAILGNTVRTGLVMGATALGDLVPIVGGAIAGTAANHFLPNGAVMGRGIIKQLSDPDQSAAMLSTFR